MLFCFFKSQQLGFENFYARNSCIYFLLGFIFSSAFSGKILSGSMDLHLPPPDRNSPGRGRPGTKRSQKEADLLSGSAVVPRQLGRQQSSINTPNVSAQINTPDVSQNLSEGYRYIERTVNNLDL